MFKSLTLSLVAMSCLLTFSLSAQSPKISIQSTLKDISGKAIPDGDVGVTFRLYHVQSGGTALWEETTVVNVVGGIYSHKLGSVTALNPANFGNTLYLGITITGGQELSPRTELTAAPYAVSVSALAANGGSASFDGNGVFTVPGQMGTIKTTGNIGIGMNAAPTWNLSLPGNNSGLHRYGDHTSLITTSQERIVLYDGETQFYVNNGQRFRVEGGGTVTSGYHAVYGDMHVNSNGSLNMPGNGNFNMTGGNLNVSNGNNAGGVTRWITLGDSDTGLRSTGDGIIQMISNGNAGITVKPNGFSRVGINNQNPTVAFHVYGDIENGYSNNYVGFSHFSGGGLTSYENNNNQPLGNAENTNDIVAYFEGGVVSNLSFYAAVNNNFSDIRTKNIVGRSKGDQDLSILNKIKITDYTMIDRVRDSKPYKKVIAQEVKEIYPQAISKTRNVIPNIMCPAAKVSRNENVVTITLEKAHGLKIGDKVEILAKEVKLNDIEVTNVIDENTFEVKTENKLSEVFVYGKYVDDFLSVDYDALSMLNISATQELYKKITALEAENKNLKSSAEGLEERMIRLEAMLTGNTQYQQGTNAAVGQK